MAINQNHTFEELDGVKCCIVEKNASQERVNFLKQLLELNNYIVIVVPSPPPKTATPVAANPNDEIVQTEIIPPTPSTFTIGVTDLSFNPTNAVWGRLLKTPEGDVVTQSYWLQKINHM
ncbi:MAG: hypothetical protein H7Y00_02545 [Fimbriimonadaceae bacterium]|nr:hypothetical protein [Chitinophagales bacterium]